MIRLCDFTFGPVNLWSLGPCKATAAVDNIDNGAGRARNPLRSTTPVRKLAELIRFRQAN